jgi:hypothetical protein
MKKLLVLFFLFVGLNGFGQEKHKEVTTEFYGFIRYEAFWDTYKGLNAANEQFFILPLYAGVDADGKPINKTLTYNFSSMATRVGVRMNGPEIFNAKTSANIETDFAGDLGNNPAMFRVRQAHVVFVWPKSSLLVGQTWHPFWGGKVFPNVGGLNTGCPFQPFNRSPQVRYDYKPTSVLTLSAAVVSEFQYKSYGFTKIESMTSAGMTIDKSDAFTRNCGIPEITTNIEMNTSAVTLGAGASLKYIKPTLYTIGASGKYDSNNLLRGVSFMGYAQYEKNMFAIRAKAVLGQNMAYLTMPGGYAVKSVDPATGAMNYSPYKTLTSFINAVYGKKYEFGFFAGYLKNLGTTDALCNFGTSSSPSAVTLGITTNVASMYRVAPHFALNVSKVRLVFEYELTSAKYGTGNIKLSDGLYSNSVDATNHRGQIMLMYYF